MARKLKTYQTHRSSIFRHQHGNCLRKLFANGTNAKTVGFDFVHHHQKYCRTKSWGCIEQNSNPSPQTSSGKLLAYLLAHGVRDLDKHLKPDADGRNRIIDMASGWLWIVLDNIKYVGALKGNRECDSLVNVIRLAILTP